MTPGVHPLVSPPAPQSSICLVVPKADKTDIRLRRLWSLGPYVRRSTGLYFLTLFPDQLPNQAGTHDGVPIIEWLFNLSVDHIHTAVLRSLAGPLPFRSPSPTYPHIRLNTECLLST